jgi:ubiquinone/menaquinone biosynthesis C-methylase UbiE
MVGTSPNRSVYVPPPIRRLQDSVKPQSGYRPLCGFTPPTFGAGVVAAQRPITCPKRQLQPERYAKYPLTFFEYSVKIWIKEENMDKNEHLEKYYSSGDEDSRLSSKYGQIEFITTMHYLDKYLSKDKRIIEVGAGTGKYSLDLANKGYFVDAVELVQHNIDVFKQKMQPENNINIYKGDAIDLNFIENEKYDITLLLGPMYHLYTIEEQKKAISEAYRITKNQGIIFIAYCIADSTIIQYGFIQNNIKAIIEKGILGRVHTRKKRENNRK